MERVWSLGKLISVNKDLPASITTGSGCYFQCLLWKVTCVTFHHAADFEPLIPLASSTSSSINLSIQPQDTMVYTEPCKTRALTACKSFTRQIPHQEVVRMVKTSMERFLRRCRCQSARDAEVITSYVFPQYRDLWLPWCSHGLLVSTELNIKCMRTFKHGDSANDKYSSFVTPQAPIGALPHHQADGSTTKTDQPELHRSSGARRCRMDGKL